MKLRTVGAHYTVNRQRRPVNILFLLLFSLPLFLSHPLPSTFFIISFSHHPHTWTLYDARSRSPVGVSFFTHHQHTCPSSPIPISPFRRPPHTPLNRSQLLAPATVLAAPTCAALPLSKPQASTSSRLSFFNKRRLRSLDRRQPSFLKLYASFSHPNHPLTGTPATPNRLFIDPYKCRTPPWCAAFICVASRHSGAR